MDTVRTLYVGVLVLASAQEFVLALDPAFGPEFGLEPPQDLRLALQAVAHKAVGLHILPVLAYGQAYPDFEPVLVRFELEQLEPGLEVESELVQGSDFELETHSLIADFADKPHPAWLL